MVCLSKSSVVGVVFSMSASYLQTSLAENVYDNLPDASNLNNLGTIRKWAEDLPGRGEIQFNGRTGYHRHESPESWADRSLYQIMTDRFNNGNGANDNTNLPGSQSNGNDLSQHRQGGDLKGITDRLPYLKEMGIGAIFITSFLENFRGDYHGYCVSNHIKVDPGWGTLEEFQDLVAAAHELDIMVIMDFVVNHMCTAYYKGDQRPNGNECKNNLQRQADEQISSNGENWVSGQGGLNFDSKFFPPMKNEKFFSRCGEGLGGTYGSEWYGDFSGAMTDINTNDADSRLLMTQMAKYWIAAVDIDGLRLDAAKHTNVAFLAYFSTHVRDYALSIGKNNFLVLGEVWSGESEKLKYLTNMRYPDVSNGLKGMIDQLRPVFEKHPVQKFPGLTSVYDFDQYYKIRNLAHANGDNDISNRIREISGYNWDSRRDMMEECDSYWVFISQHDVERIMRGNNRNHDTPGLASALQAMVIGGRGVPHLYMGDEQGFNGECINPPNDSTRNYCSRNGDSLFRQTMWVGAPWNLGSNLQSINNLARMGGNREQNQASWESDPFLDRSNPIFQRVKQMHHLRNSCNVLRRGSQWHREAGAIVAYGRVLMAEDKEIVVLVNLQNKEMNVPDIIVDLNIHEIGDVFQNALSQATDEISVAASGTSKVLKFNNQYKLPAYGVAVFVQKRFMNTYNSEYGTRLCSDVDISPTPRPTPLPNPPTVPGETRFPSVSPTLSPTMSPTRNETTTMPSGGGGLGAAGSLVLVAVALLAGIGLLFVYKSKSQTVPESTLAIEQQYSTKVAQVDEQPNVMPEL